MAGLKMADLYEEAKKVHEDREKVYGDRGYEPYGDLMAGMFPDGISLKTETDFADFHLFTMMAIKLNRVAMGLRKGQGLHIDSLGDIANYALLLKREAMEREDG